MFTAGQIYSIAALLQGTTFFLLYFSSPFVFPLSYTAIKAVMKQTCNAPDIYKKNTTKYNRQKDPHGPTDQSSDQYRVFDHYSDRGILLLEIRIKESQRGNIYIIACPHVPLQTQNV